MPTFIKKKQMLLTNFLNNGQNEIPHGCPLLKGLTVLQNMVDFMSATNMSYD